MSVGSEALPPASGERLRADWYVNAERWRRSQQNETVLGDEPERVANQPRRSQRAWLMKLRDEENSAGMRCQWRSSSL